MKKIVISTIAVSMLLIAVVAFAYPFINNYIMTVRSDSAVVQYIDVTSDMTQEEISEKKKLAQEYNESLIGNITLGDPFAAALDKKNEYAKFLEVDESAVMATINIPKIDINLPIYYGTSEDVLGKGIGHLANSSLPIGGKATHSVLTGHTGYGAQRLFSDLETLEMGDYFYINCLGEVLVYKVDNIAVVLPDETDLLQIEGEQDYVTLVTCTPFGINTHRLLVRGKRVIMGEDDTDLSAYRTYNETKSNWMGEYQLAIILGIATMVTVLIIFAIIKLIFYIIKARKKNEK